MRTTRERRAVLVVDDDADARAIHGTVLRRAGYKVITATTGPAAIAAFARYKPVLTLIDIALPGLDGLTVIDRVRSDGTLGDCRVIVITAMSRFPYEDRAVELGCDAFLVKPVLPDVLVAMANHLVGPTERSVTGELDQAAAAGGEAQPESRRRKK